MNALPQPKVTAVLRAFAGTCALLWFAGIAFCGLERVHQPAAHEKICAGHSGAIHAHNAVSSLEKEERHHHPRHPASEGQAEPTAAGHHHDGTTPVHHGCKGKECGGEQRCCSTIQAPIFTPTPIVISRPVSLWALVSFFPVREHSLTIPSTDSLRQSKTPAPVSTPEICLSPAHRGLAPPSLS